jgi:hypothetical protein
MARVRSFTQNVLSHLIPTLLTLTPLSAARADPPAFDLHEPTFPDEISAALIAGRIQPELNRFLMGRLDEPTCGGTSHLDETICRDTSEFNRGGRLEAEAHQAINTHLREITDAFQGPMASMPTPYREEIQSCTATERRLARQAARLQDFPARVPIASLSDEELLARWIETLSDGATWESELSDSALTRVCDPLSFQTPPYPSLTLALTRARFASLQTRCPGPDSRASDWSRFREEVRRAFLSQLRAKPEEATPSLRAYVTRRFQAWRQPLVPQECRDFTGYPSSRFPEDLARQCTCAADLYDQNRNEFLNGEIERNLRPISDTVLSDLREEISESRFSEPLQRALNEVLRPEQINFRAFDHSFWQANFGRGDQAIIEPSYSFVMNAGNPAYRGVVRATLAHEFGHWIDQLLSSRCQSSDLSSFCQDSLRIRSAMAPQDLEILRGTRDCIDRNFLYGEWADAHRDDPVPPEGILSGNIMSKRGEYFGDVWMRIEMRSLTPAQRRQAVRMLCIDQRDAAEAADSGESHPGRRYRIEHALNRGTHTGAPGESQEPPYACEEIISPR